MQDERDFGGLNLDVDENTTALGLRNWKDTGDL